MHAAGVPKEENIMRRSIAAGLGLASSAFFFISDNVSGADLVAALAVPTVVVTGNRFDEKRADLPVGVQIVTADDIGRSGALTLPEVLARQAGFTVRDNSGSPNRQIDLRGFGISGDQNTLILVNGQRLSENETTPADLASVSLADVERIEILRGSGAVLYGGGATGGTVNIITRGPRPGDRSARLGATAGNYGTYGATASASVASERLGLSVNASSLASDNYRVNNDLRQDNLSAELAWFGDRGPVTLRVASGNQDLRLPGSRSEAELATDRRGTANPNDFMSLDSARVAVATVQRVGDAELALDVGHRERKSRSYQFGGFNDVNGRVVNVAPRVRLPFATGQVSHRLVAGLDWDEWDFDNRIPSFGYNGKALQRNLAAYVQDAMRISPDLTVSVGAREQRVRTALSEQSFGQQDASKERTVRAWELAARQNLDAEWLAYAKTGRSFRMPVVDEIRGFGFVPPALLEPQVSRDWEMGLEGVGEGRRLRLAVFRSNLENEIMYVPPPLLGANTNLPPTRREGVEVDGQFTLAPDLTLAASYAWIRARFRDGLIGGTDVTGKEIPLVPRHRAGATLSWQPAPGWQSSVTVTHTGSQVYDNDQTNSFGRRIASFTVVDLAAAWDSGPWVLRAAVLNATSEEYHTYAIANLTTGSFNAYPAALRTFLLSASYRFDRR